MIRTGVDPNQSRKDVPIEDAIARLPPGDYVHTFLPRGVLLGVEVPREDVIAAMRAYGVEEAGDTATRLGHTLVVRDYPGGALFVEARPAADVEAQP